MLARSALKPRLSRSRAEKRPAAKSAPGYLQWLRGRECACGGKLPWCGGKIVAAHVDHAGGKGVGTKVADQHAIPLSDQCHREQHIVGWQTFEKHLPGGDAVKLAAEYWRAWPGLRAWLQKLTETGR